MARGLTLLSLALLLVAGGGCVSRQETTQASPNSVSADTAAVSKGAALAAIGNCASCHTAEDGRTFAGGRALPTPFGTVYSTNLTPDPETGLGRWSAQEFRRAMHEGIGRDGRELYPAFPYDHFTRVTDEDVDAIFAYLKTRDPLRSEIPENRVLVPRPLVAVWKSLYFSPGVLQPEPSRDPQWNRGRYLVEGLGHCGACHTPRNALGAEKPDQALAGGQIEGWSAPALDQKSPSPRPWTVDDLTTYLRTGFDAHHGVAAGAMAEVTQNLKSVPEADVRAISVYVVALMYGSNARQAIAANPLPTNESIGVPEDAVSDSVGGAATAADGAAIYKSTCAGCHERAQRGIPLSLSTAVTDVSSANLVRITLGGIMPLEGQAGGIMPGFNGALSDRQIAALADYLRREIGRAPPWSDLDREIAKARHEAKGRKPS